jgi:predicted nucleic acid-binding protein
VSISDVLSGYEVRLTELHTGLRIARVHHTTAVVVLVVALSFFFSLGVSAIRKQMPFWSLFVPGSIAVLAAWRYRRYKKTRSQAWRLTRFYDRATKRVQDDWLGAGSTGERLIPPGHAYANDLNIFGSGSLFELLWIGRSGIGQLGLAEYLLKPATVEIALARQEAIRELREKRDLREKIALLGRYEFQESRWETFAEWLDAPVTSFPASLSPILLATSSVLAIVFLAALLAGGTLFPWRSVAQYVVPILLMHSALGLIMRRRVSRIIDAASTLSVETRVLREGLEILEREPFASARLREIAHRARNGGRSVRALDRMLAALSEANKEWFYLPSLALMFRTQLCIATERWRANNGATLRGWMEAWAEFEALNSLANYAHENPDAEFPELCAGGAEFDAQGIGHPLIPRAVCVRSDVELINHVELHRGSRFYIVSGSNMAGKSTLLRAIGLNAVLAMAGAPVRARALRMSRLSVCASIAVVDSLLSGKSKFLSEVDRLRQAIEVSDGDQVLFLVDEILSGTNSRDRRVAVEAVVRTLVGRGAIGAISTHDLALAEIAEDAELGGANVHMGSSGKGDPMDFDYLLKPGVTRETNALAIARMAGVPV